MMTTRLSSSLVMMGESLVLLCCVLIINLILIYWLCYVCKSWIDYSVEEDSRKRLVNQVLGNLIHLHQPSVVTLPENSHRELTTTVFSEWRQQDYPGSSVARLLGKYFLHVWFFHHYPSVLLCFLLQILLCSYASGCPRRATIRHTHFSQGREGRNFLCSHLGEQYVLQGHP
jgi:hypothetical protein